MKKKILSLLLLIAATFSLPAHAIDFDWGVTGGVNISKLRLKSDLKQNFSADNKAGWYLGVKAHASLLMGFGLDGSLLYSQEKYNLDARGVGYAGDNKTARYLSVPINLRYDMGIGSLATVYVATGPQFDMALGSKNWDITDPNYTGNDVFKSESWTTSWNVGAGVKVLDTVELNVTYNFGLSDVTKTVLSNLGQNVRTDNVKANTFKVGLTVYF